MKKTRKEAKCTFCKTTISFGDLQASREGPYRAFNLMWIKRTSFFFSTARMHIKVTKKRIHKTTSSWCQCDL